MNDLLIYGLMDVQEASAFLRLGRSTIYGLMDSGQLGYVKIGRARRIPRRALIELAAASWVGPRPAAKIADADETGGHHT